MKLNKNLIVLLLTFLLTGCYEAQEGCLDVRATNFDLEADTACPECCEYPFLKTKASHQHIIGEETYPVGLMDSVYLDGNGQAFRIKSIRYFLSDFSLIKTTGEAVQVDDHIDILVSDGTGGTVTSTFVDDFILINAASNSTVSIGTFSAPGTYSGIKFKVGLEASIDTALPDEFPDNHPLSNTSDAMYDAINGHYLSTKIEIFQDTTAQDTIPRQIQEFASGGGRDITLSFAENTTIGDGFSATISLGIDCLSWFAESDVRNDSDNELATQVIGKISESISVLEVLVGN